jgi:hypothetical protein
MTAGKHELRLHEQILLLGLRDEHGGVESRAGMFNLALGGALLSELSLERRIDVGLDKKKLVTAVGQGPLGDDVLDEALGRVERAKRRRSAAGWVSNFAGIRRLRHRVAENLCRRGVLRDSEQKILLLFTRKLYPTIDPEPERRLRAALTDAVTGDGEVRDARVSMLVALAHATGLLRVVFDRKTLRARKSRLESIVNGHAVGGATREAVVAVQVAVTVAVTAAVVASTTASTS